MQRADEGMSCLTRAELVWLQTMPREGTGEMAPLRGMRMETQPHSYGKPGSRVSGVLWDTHHYWLCVGWPQAPPPTHVSYRRLLGAVPDFSLRVQEVLESTALVKLCSRSWMMTCDAVKPRIWTCQVNKHQQVAITQKFKALIFTVGLLDLIKAGGAIRWWESNCLV